MSKISDFICKEFDTIIKDSREYRAYELGMANGFFELYRYIKTDIDILKLIQEQIKQKNNLNILFKEKKEFLNILID